MLGRLIRLLAADAKAQRRAAAEDLIALARESDEAVSALRDALADKDWRRRWGAAFALYRLGMTDDGVFEAVLGALGAPDGDVRWAAVGIVVALALSDSERRRRIRAVVADREPIASKMALYCLRDLGDEGEAWFADALAQGDPGVRRAAISGLARLSVLSGESVDALLAVVQSDPEPGVRRAAAVALGRATNHAARARPVLEDLSAQSADVHLARAAKRALASLGADGEAE